MVVGETSSLKLVIGGHKVKMAFTVIEGMEVDCILGMDYLDKTKVVIFPSERKLRFPGDLEVYSDQRKSKEDALETKDKNIVTGAIIEPDEVKLFQEEKYVMEDDGNVIRTMWQQDNKEETLRAEDPIFVREDEAVMDDKEIVLKGRRQFEKVSRAEDPLFVRKDEDIME